MLRKDQFDILDYLVEDNGIAEKKEIASKFALNEKYADEILSELSACGMISNRHITELGRTALEPYRVKRAIFMAAGLGSRLTPLTINTPKALIRVHGKRMIDTLIDAVIAAGIDDIYIVRGYLGEQFDQLLHKYPMIKFIENPFYADGNNILSMACAGDIIKNAYVLESDLVLFNPELIRKYQYYSNYLAIPVKKTNDWCFFVEDGIIKGVAEGGENCWQVVGISYWTEYDGARIVTHIKDRIRLPGGRNVLWGSVILDTFKDQYTVRVRECKLEDVVEIDSYNELKAIDSAYNI